MEQTKEFFIRLDKKNNKDLIDEFKSNIFNFDTEAKLERFKILKDRYEDNNLSIAFIKIKLSKLGITNKKFELENRLHTIENSNKRIIEAIKKLM